MKKRTLGRSGLEVFPLALGCNVFGWTVDEPTAFRLLDQFVASGGNFLDTADTYARWVQGNRGGESESIIGKWLKRSGKRKKVILATKVGSEMGLHRKGLAKKYILYEIEESLKRLQTDTIDLYQSHRDDPATPLEETLEAYAQLIKEGKVRVIGASNYSTERLHEALQISDEKGYPRYQSLQPRYNLYDRAEFEAGLEPLCRDKGLGVISYSSLAGGFLSGKYRTSRDLSKSLRGEGVRIYMNDRGFRILRALDEVAERHQAQPASVALAWLMNRPSITAPISSATSVEQLDNLIAATELELDQDSISLLDQASRYSEERAA